jgi:hypothetical protein
MGKVYKAICTAVEKRWSRLWKSEVSDDAHRFRGQKNKGAGSAPESRKYLGLNGLKEGTYFLPFFPFFVLFLAAFFLAGMWTVTSSWQIRLTVPKAAC